MSEKPETIPSGDTQADPSGTQEPNPATPNENITPPEREKVAYETHRKLLGEKKSLQEKYETLLKEKKEEENRKLEESNEWKKLYENKTQELEEVHQKLQKRDQQVNDGLKLQAFLNAVGGEIEEQYWGLIPVEKIDLNPETSQPDEYSVQKLVDEFKTRYSRVIAAKTDAKLPNDASGGVPTSGRHFNRDSFKALSLDEKKNNLAQAVANWKP